MKDLALDLMPQTARRYVEDILDAVGIAAAVENKQVLAGMLPSVGRGFVQQVQGIAPAERISRRHLQ